MIHRKWHIFLENDCVYCQSSFICCIMSCFPRLCWLDRYMPGWAFGWAGQQWLSFWGHIPAVRKGALAGCDLALLLPLFLLHCVSPSVIDVLRTWLIFHLQPASQLSTEPPAQMHQDILLSKTCQLLRGYVLFGEFKGWCTTWPRLLYESPLPTEFIPFCLFHFYMLGGNSRDAGFALFMLFVSLYCSQRYYKHVPPFFAIPRSTGIKSHSSAVEAVIPCCQSPLYCRSCICSFLELSFEGVGAAGTSTYTFCAPSQMSETKFPHTNQHFLVAKGESRLDKYVYPHWLLITKTYANA